MSIFDFSNLKLPATQNVGDSNGLAAPKVDANSMQAALYGGQAPLTANDILNNNAKAAAPVKPLPDPQKPSALQASEANDALKGAAQNGTNAPSSVTDTTTGAAGTTTGAAGTATPPYLADWDNTTFEDAYKKGDRSIADYASDYERWANANGKAPLDYFQFYQAVNGNDIGKSYQENEREKKRLEREQKWDRIANVLTHLGNFVGTIAGAPSQKLESGEELTARQQAVKDAIMKQRGDPRNIYAMILKQRANDRANDLNDANIALRGAQQKRTEGAAANDKAESDAKVGVLNAQQEENKKHGDLYEAQTNYTNDKNDREKQLQPHKKKVLDSQAYANHARGTASYASAESSRATASKTRSAAGRLSKEAEADKDFYSLYNDPVGRKYIDQYATNNHLDVGNNTSGMSGGGSWSNKNNRIAAVKWARSNMQGRKSTGVAWKNSTKKISLGMHWKKSK